MDLALNPEQFYNVDFWFNRRVRRRKAFEEEEEEEEPPAPEGEVSCRICFDTVEKGMCTPCKCTGTMAHAHKACIRQWIRTSNSRLCPNCRQRFILSVPTTDFFSWFWRYQLLKRVWLLWSCLFLVGAGSFVDYFCEQPQIWKAIYDCTASEGFQWLFSAFRTSWGNMPIEQGLSAGLSHLGVCRCFFILHGTHVSPFTYLFVSVASTIFWAAFLIASYIHFYVAYLDFDAWKVKQLEQVNQRMAYQERNNILGRL